MHRSTSRSSNPPPSDVMRPPSKRPITSRRHGHQEGRFFHGYYRCYCYLPLYIFCGEHLLCARLRPADRDASAGSIDELQRIVGRIRARWLEDAHCDPGT